MKIINRTKLLAEYRHVLSQEISCIMKLEHCNIIRLFEVHESFLRLCLFMEYASEGDLHSRVLLDGPFSEQRAKEVFVQVVAGVTYMVREEEGEEKGGGGRGGGEGGRGGGNKRRDIGCLIVYMC